MAVIKTVWELGGHTFCLLLDADEDTVEVVYERGFYRDDDGELEFFPSYYEERVTEGAWDSVMVRCLEDTGVAAGLMIERVSHRPRRWRGENFTALESIQTLMALAFQHLPDEAEQLKLPTPTPDLLWLNEIPTKTNGKGVRG